jgi:hypothetical protein
VVYTLYKVDFVIVIPVISEGVEAVYGNYDNVTKKIFASEATNFGY